MLLSVIIVAYNNGLELRDCLDSIIANNDLGEDLEVIVVDNSSEDIVEKSISDYPNINLIKNPENGFGKGNNIGYQHSSGDFLLFLNPDTIVLNPCFAKLIQQYLSDGRNGVIGVKLVDADGHENNSYNIRLKYGLFKKLLLKASCQFKFFISKYMYTCGADIFISRSLFENIGCFDENIFMYGEEEDIAFRLDKVGKRVTYFPEITIVHLQGKSSGHKELINRKRMAVSSEYICKKYNIDFKKEIRKEIRAMKLINFLKIIVGKEPKYNSEIVEYYESLIKE